MHVIRASLIPSEERRLPTPSQLRSLDPHATLGESSRTRVRNSLTGSRAANHGVDTARLVPNIGLSFSSFPCAWIISTRVRLWRGPCRPRFWTSASATKYNWSDHLHPRDHSAMVFSSLWSGGVRIRPLSERKCFHFTRLWLQEKRVHDEIAPIPESRLYASKRFTLEAGGID